MTLTQPGKKIKHNFRSTGKFCTCSKLNSSVTYFDTSKNNFKHVFQLEVSKVYFKNSKTLTFFLIFCSVFSNWNLHPYYIVSQVVLLSCKLFAWEQVFCMKITNNLLTIISINVLASTGGTHIFLIGYNSQKLTGCQWQKDLSIAINLQCHLNFHFVRRRLYRPPENVMNTELHWTILGR